MLEAGETTDCWFDEPDLADRRSWAIPLGHGTYQGLDLELLADRGPAVAGIEHRGVPRLGGRGPRVVLAEDSQLVAGLQELGLGVEGEVHGPQSTPDTASGQPTAPRSASTK